jgi:hypothetical protein
LDAGGLTKKRQSSTLLPTLSCAHVPEETPRRFLPLWRAAPSEEFHVPTRAVSSTYRGYRKQALYVLWRLLTDADAGERAYRPEGDEDLAVFDSQGRLAQVVQVKDYTSPLTVSDLKPNSPDGFFARTHRRLLTHPECEVWLASFGPLGPELTGAVGASGPLRRKVALKVANGGAGLSIASSERVLGALQGRVSRPNENAIRADVLQALAPTIAGVRGATALELLLYWIFDASEQQRTINRSDLLSRLEGIGAYLSALRDHSAEWNVSVTALTEQSLSDAEIDQLRASYRSGSQAKWEHILAGLDSPRPRRVSELHELVRSHQIVVIRGASGQGKSTLALRYLRDFVPDGLRFYVRFVEGRSHGIRIARAVREHIVALGLRAVVLIDLAPSDAGWMDLAQDLAQAGARVLVAVREEDFHRAGSASRDVSLSELALDSVTRDEAQEIYAALVAGTPRTAHVDFEDAWSTFTGAAGDDIGPLLEFTHVVAEGETLAKKIAGQISRLQREAVSSAAFTTPRHLRLLALAAIANEAECRVSLQALCAAVGLDPLTRPLEVLENEYLLKTVSAGHRPDRLGHIADQTRDLGIGKGEPEEHKVSTEKQFSEELHVRGAIAEGSVVPFREDQRFWYLNTPMQPNQKRAGRHSRCRQVGVGFAEHIPRLLGFGTSAQ